MTKVKGLINLKFGRLTVIKQIEKRNNNRQVEWHCRCDCGLDTVVIGNNLKNGHTKSCGCLEIENRIKHGMCGTPTYISRGAMGQRCNNPNNPAYPNYGGRGIKICDRWKDFAKFFKDMGERPKGLTIERFDNDGIYEPSNCAWRSRTHQMRNKRLDKRNKTGTPGVCWDKRRQNYNVRITIKHKTKHVGCFANLNQAVIVRKQAEQKYWDKPIIP